MKDISGGLINCVLIVVLFMTGLVLFREYHVKETNYLRKEKEQIQFKYEQLENENKVLKVQLDELRDVTTVNWDVIVAVVNQNEQLQRKFEQLSKQNDKAKKELNKVKDSSKHIIMKIEKN